MRLVTEIVGYQFRDCTVYEVVTLLEAEIGPLLAELIEILYVTTYRGYIGSIYLFICIQGSSQKSFPILCLS